MEIFLDTASIAEIDHIIKWGVVDGVTTNQKIFLNEKGVRFEQRVLEICERLGKLPVSVESNGSKLEEIIHDARNFTKIAPNVVPKIAMTGDGMGLEAINTLSKEGISINVTVMMNLNQLILATKAGARYVSLFFNRAKDAGEDPLKTIQSYTKWTKENNYSTKLIVGSIRLPTDVEQIAAAGAHIITIPYKIIREMPFHKKTEETIIEFDKAWKEFNNK
jgi:transaldolase